MTWLVGVDEAGYGPNLGPLVVAATAWRLPDTMAPADTDLYQLLDSALTAAPDGRRLVVADSKQVYKPGQGLSALETTVLAVLPSRGVVDYRGLVDALEADPIRARELLPWQEGFNPPLPCEACPNQVAGHAAAVAGGCRAAGVEPPVVMARMVFPAEFNGHIDHYGGKGAALSHVTLGLLRASWMAGRGRCTSRSTSTAVAIATLG